jgi:hypothetical protein
VVKSERICSLLRDVGISAVPDNSSSVFLASFRIKFRENYFVACFYMVFYFFKFYFKVYSSNHSRKI